MAYLYSLSFLAILLSLLPLHSIIYEVAVGIMYNCTATSTFEKIIL